MQAEFCRLLFGGRRHVSPLPFHSVSVYFHSQPEAVDGAKVEFSSTEPTIFLICPNQSGYMALDHHRKKKGNEPEP